jgi:hypothetical protein
LKSLGVGKFGYLLLRRYSLGGWILGGLKLLSIMVSSPFERAERVRKARRANGVSLRGPRVKRARSEQSDRRSKKGQNWKESEAELERK